MTLTERLACVSKWLGQRLCGLRTGHHYIRQPEPTRIVLLCWHCNHESPGWSLPEEPAHDRRGD